MVFTAFLSFDQTALFLGVEADGVRSPPVSSASFGFSFIDRLLPLLLPAEAGLSADSNVCFDSLDRSLLADSRLFVDPFFVLASEPAAFPKDPEPRLAGLTCPGVIFGLPSFRPFSTVGLEMDSGSWARFFDPQPPIFKNNT